MRSTFFIVLILALGATDARPQSPPPGGLDPELALTQYVHDVWETADGLPQNSVSSMAQTPDGYLWMGTQEGLVRFDGVAFTVFSPETHDAFEVSDIISLSVAGDGTLWIATRGGGLVSYSGGEFNAPGLGRPDIPRTTTSVFVADDGLTWAGTYGRGLMCVEPDTVRVFHELAGFDGKFIGSVRSDHAGRLWVGSDRGLFEFDGEHFIQSQHEVLQERFVTAVFGDEDETLWVATRDERLYAIRGDRITDHTDWLSDGPGMVKAILRDRHGTLWFGRLGGGLLRIRDGRVDRMTTNEGLSDDQVTSLLEDREGSLWIGTAGGGLNRLRQGKFTPITAMEGLPHDNTFSVIEDHSGILWIATEDGVAGFQRNKRVAQVTGASGLDEAHVQALAVDQENQLWIGTAGAGVYVRAADGALTHIDVDEGLTGGVVFALYNDRADRMWIGTDAGVNMFDKTGVHTLSTDTGLTSNFPTYFAEDSQGGIWIGTYDAGLNYWHEGRITRTVSTDDGLATNEILALLVDEQDRLWVGSYGAGLDVLDGDTVVHLDAANGLFNDKVLSLVPDGHGRMWMSSNRGISYVSVEDVLALEADPTRIVAARAFGAPDGLDPEEASGGQQPSGWRSHTGDLWFPTVHGAVSIDPDDYPLNPFEPPVVIESLTVDGGAVDTRGDIILPAGSDRLEFGYTSTTLSASQETLFRYRLDGYKEAWTEAGQRRATVYTNLSPGWYTFELLATSHDGVDTESPAKLRFFLTPHFWQTGWFRLLALVLIIAAVGAAYQARIAQHRRRAEYLESQVDLRTKELREEKERTEKAKDVIEAQANKLKELDHFKTRFFANVSHEFRTPLTMIIGPLENALAGGYGQLGSAVQRQMDIMLRNALRLMRLINQLLDLSKLEAGKMQLKAGARNLVSFLQGVLLTIEPFADKKGLTLEFDSSDPEVSVFFEPDKLEKVFYNLLSNASKFTPGGGSIGITVETLAASDAYPRGCAEVIVRDSGRGIPPEDLPHIFDRFHQVDGSNTRQHEGTGIGLSLVKEMVELHGGEVNVTSQVGVGTEFRIFFPLGSSHLKADQIVEVGALSAPRDLNVATAQAELTTSEATQATQDEPPEQVADPDAPRILIVDDNADVREYVGSIVAPFYRTLYAVDGQDGLEKARAELPDLIISDIMMPRMDGNELCRIVKSSAELAHTPVILVSARATHEVKIEGLEVGADDYVPKPFNATELLARVRNLLKLRHHEKKLKELNENLEDVIQDQLTTILSEREKYEEELIDARDKAEASAKLKSAILDNMNHEFRTPLAIIMGSVQVLAEDVEGEHRTFLGDIEAGTLRLQRTLEAVAELSELSADDKATPERIDLASTARRTVDRYLAKAEKKGIVVRAHFPRDSQVDVRTGRQQIHRLLDILVDNAVKFTDEGEVLVSIEQRANDTQVVVQDTGVGMTPEFCAQAFDAFAQESSGLARTHEGFGLGLTIAERLAGQIGAELDLVSEVGKGTKVTVRMPAPKTKLATPDPKRAAATD